MLVSKTLNISNGGRDYNIAVMHLGEIVRFCFVFFCRNLISYLSLVTVFFLSFLSCCASCHLFIWFAVAEVCLHFFLFSFFVSYRWGKHYDLNPRNSHSADLLCVAWLDRKYTWGAARLWGGGGRDKDLIMREGEEAGPRLPSGTGITWERIVQIRPAVSPQTHLWPPWINCKYDLVQKKML